jgi:membrane associated rhomboid family serine protease
MPSSASSIFYLLIINIALFLMLYFLQVSQLMSFALYFPINEQFHYWQFLTHMFMHGGIVHLLFNMYALWAFGTPLENTWKTPKFIFFYFATGIGAGIIYSLANYYQFNNIYSEISSLGYSVEAIESMLNTGYAEQNLITHVGKDRLIEFISIFNSPAVGASGAIYGLLVAFAFTYPHAKLALIFFPVPVRAKYFVPVIIFVDLFFGITKYSVGNVAHFAHIGGALTGLVMMLFWRYKSTVK